jgi:hypothetical protein
MHKMKYIIIGLSILAFLAVAFWFRFGSVVYLGHRIWLSVLMLDYDTFKNTEGNLSESQAKRVEKLLLAAPIAKEYSSHSQLTQRIFDLVFPGYGMGSAQSKTQDGDRLLLYCVEIPTFYKDRCLLFHETSDGRFRLIDDFISPSTILSFELEADGPVYRDAMGKEVNISRVGMTPVLGE